jgi:hypothetical protein
MAVAGHYGVPDVDNVSGNWSPSTGADLYAVIDEFNTDYSDGAYIASENNPVSDFCRIGCDDLYDPGEHDNHYVFAGYHKQSSGGRQIDLTFHCYEGSTQRASTSFTDISNVINDGQLLLTTGEASNITSYTNLEIGFTANAVGGGAGREARVEYAWIRIFGQDSSFNSSYMEIGNDDREFDLKNTSGSTATADVTANGAITSSYGLECTADNSGDSDDEETYILPLTCRSEFDGLEGGTDILVLEFSFRWDSWTRSGYNTAISKGPAILYSGWERILNLSVSGTRQLQLHYKAKDGTNTSVSGTQTFTLDQDYAIRITLDKSGANPVISWDVDGGEIGSDTDTSSGSAGVGRAWDTYLFWSYELGVAHAGQFEAMGYEWSIDDVLILDTETVGGVSVTLAAVSAAGAVVAPTVVLGSTSITPAEAAAAADTIDPAVLLGSTSVTPAAVSTGAATVDPAVVLGSLVITPAVVTAGADLVDPTVVLGSVVVTPAEAAAAADIIDPAVVLGSTSVTPAVAAAVTSTVDPVVLTGGDELVIPAPVSAAADTIDPTVIEGGDVSITPGPAVAATATIALTVVLGSVSVTPAPAATVTATVDPTVSLGGLIVSPAAAAAATSIIDPAVIYGSISITPSLAASVAVTIDPAVVLGSTVATPAWPWVLFLKVFSEA